MPDDSADRPAASPSDRSPDRAADPDPGAGPDPRAEIPDVVAGAPVGLGGFDLSSLMDSAQQLVAAQQQAAAQEVVGRAGGGKVEVAVTGGGEFRRVTISPDVVDPDDVALLEDLVLAALHDAMTQVNSAQSSALGGFDLGSLGGLGGLLGDG
jgi:DNA-binding YbaB/EbfC family protein